MCDGLCSPGTERELRLVAPYGQVTAWAPRTLETLRGPIAHRALPSEKAPKVSAGGVRRGPARRGHTLRSAVPVDSPFSFPLHTAESCMCTTDTGKSKVVLSKASVVQRKSF